MRVFKHKIYLGFAIVLFIVCALVTQDSVVEEEADTVKPKTHNDGNEGPPMGATNTTNDIPTSIPTGPPTPSPASNHTVEPGTPTTAGPTTSQTNDPTANPTFSPTITPTNEPTGVPTSVPTTPLTGEPTSHPAILAQNIALNQDYSYVTSDITQILHIPAKTRIEIHLQPQRSCHNPVFKGRISGWSLSMINFGNVVDDVIVGTYDLFHMPKSGNYHVEILLLLCEKYKEGFQSSLNLMTVCLADRTDENGLITSKKNASIAVDLSHQRLENKKARGRWLHKSLLSDQHQLSNSPLLEQPKPLLTRFQPESCFQAVNRNSSYCKQFNEDRLMGFNDYNFLWNSGTDAELNQPGLSNTLLEQYQRRLIEQPIMPGRKLQVFS
mmetsp:Transcript_23508/g.36292  ORF Transcript_23508/g.36292 Transcript_23508/m.36292 type:complete len:382 (+) Transcript_23508:131-1276(+)